MTTKWSPPEPVDASEIAHRSDSITKEDRQRPDTSPAPADGTITPGGEGATPPRMPGSPSEAR